MSNSSSSSSSSGGVGFLGLLTVLFIALKLTNVITWSWWFVMLPLYGPVVVAVVCIVIGLCILIKGE